MTDTAKLIATLKDRMSSVPVLPDEPDFTVSEQTIVRFLKANDWKMKEAEKGLLNTVEYRRQTRPLTLDCHWCHDRPGYHSMRQVGHDELGRPVIYANFGQASVRKNSAEDIIAHVTYLIENAKATMENGVTTWVFVIDCSWMTLSACNPRLSFGVANTLASHYPERLGLVICVNHSSLFHGVWKALKKLLSPGTVAKVKLAKSDWKIQQLFSNYFSEELSAWLLQEMALNRQSPIPRSQREFWNPPQVPGSHDPRGCPSYIEKYVHPSQGQDLTFVPGRKKPHNPHPNIIDVLRSKVVSLLPEEFDDGSDVSEEADMAGFGASGNTEDDTPLSDDNRTEMGRPAQNLSVERPGSTETDRPAQTLSAERPGSTETGRHAQNLSAERPGSAVMGRHAESLSVEKSDSAEMTRINLSAESLSAEKAGSAGTKSLDDR